MKRSKVIELLTEKLLDMYGPMKEEMHAETFIERHNLAKRAIKAMEELELLPPNALGTNWRGRWEKEDEEE